MKRSTFFKSLIAVIVSPKILSEIKWAKPKPKLNGVILSDLNFVTPSYFQEYVAKYGNEDFVMLMKKYGERSEEENCRFDFYNFSKGEIETHPTASEPVTITINKRNYAGFESI